MVMGFQKRYWWQISSILQQVAHDGWPVPRIRLKMSVTERDPFFHWNERLLEAFDGLLDLHMDVWPADDDTYGRRGHIRSRNLQETQADYILFNDGDMIYHPTFFAQLLRELSRPEHLGERRVFATWRMSMSFEDGYKLVDSVEYDRPVEGSFDRMLEVPTWRAARGRISGAGFFQCVDMEQLHRQMRENGHEEAWYVEPGWNKDHNTFERNHITRSDRCFRMRCGGIVPLPDLPAQYHLNHYRKDKPEWNPYLVH